MTTPLHVPLGEFPKADDRPDGKDYVRRTDTAMLSWEYQELKIRRQIEEENHRSLLRIAAALELIAASLGSSREGGL